MNFKIYKNDLSLEQIISINNWLNDNLTLENWTLMIIDVSDSSLINDTITTISFSDKDEYILFCLTFDF